MWSQGEVFKLGNKNVPNEIHDLFKHEQDTIQDVKKVFKKEFSTSKINSGRASVDLRVKSANNRYRKS